MPFPVHLVTPVRMSDTKIPPDTENKLESVTNTTLSQVSGVFAYLDSAKPVVCSSVGLFPTNDTSH